MSILNFSLPGARCCYTSEAPSTVQKASLSQALQRPLVRAPGVRVDLIPRCQSLSLADVPISIPKPGALFVFLFSLCIWEGHWLAGRELDPPAPTSWHRALISGFG